MARLLFSCLVNILLELYLSFLPITDSNKTNNKELMHYDICLYI